MELVYSRLLLAGHLFLFLWAIWVPIVTGADVLAGQRPGCPARCGDVDIPFPFGIGDQCAMQTEYPFMLDCVSVAGTNKPLFRGAEVISISVEEGKAWLKNNISSQCYDPSTNTMKHNNTSVDFSGSPFWISENDNKIVAVGCQSRAYMKIDDLVIGCSLKCNEDFTPRNGLCSGAGCCQLGVPKGIWYYTSYLNETSNIDGDIWRRSPCSYTAVIETTSFNFNTTYLNSTVFYDTYKGVTPIVLDWIIRMDTCINAKRNASLIYACVSANSDCVDETKGGYRCKCAAGYQGNPYINDGCKDIDECVDNATYPCAGICNNMPGNFTCSCHPGSYMMNGVCVQNQKSTVASGLLVGLGVGGGTCLLSLVFGVILVMKNLKVLRARALRAKYFEQNRGFLLEQLVDKDIAERMIFSLEELEKATNMFDDARKLGGGGHGTVYKGILSNQHVVAIKKSKSTIQREINDFINEVAILSQINHRNVVRLFGCCLEAEVPLLVYEFISNGTLSDHLHCEGPQYLSWKNRMRVALETASALAYLHSSASTSVIHRDIKSDNILLDDRLTAKVSDFGASRGIPIGQTGVTTAIQGTFGYLDPEYYQTSRLTDKSDVYSFGVILVELLTRKRPNSFMSSERVSLIAHFNLLMSQDKLCEILDPQVIQEGAEDAHVVAAIAATCLCLNGKMRPSMRQVEIGLQRLLVADSNIAKGSMFELNHDTSTKMIHDEDNNSSKKCSIEQEALLSASFPR